MKIFLQGQVCSVRHHRVAVNLSAVSPPLSGVYSRLRYAQLIPDPQHRQGAVLFLQAVSAIASVSTPIRLRSVCLRSGSLACGIRFLILWFDLCYLKRLARFGFYPSIGETAQFPQIWICMGYMKYVSWPALCGFCLKDC